VESGCTLLVVHCRANRALLIAVEIAEVQDSDRKSSRKPASKAELKPCAPTARSSVLRQIAGFSR